MKVIVIGVVFISSVICSPRSGPVVDTSKGLIKGLQATDGDYAMFMGIPYARVDERNPFGPSHPYPNFDGVFEAYDDSAKCPQIDEFSLQIEGSLDCLTLNIYVPNNASTENPLPVLVWIYGGRFQIGSAGRYIYGPKYLVRHDVILITVNYRVGPYGFMCLDTKDVPGNQGLKDQLGALRWIKENIGAFGGDADKVTLFGESAGGVSVDFHQLYTQDLFDKVIFQSGSALCPWAVTEADREQPVKIAQRLGLDTEDVEDALAFLATLEPASVVRAALQLSMSFFPCVEKEFDGVERYMPVHPVQKTVNKTDNVPVLAGYNSRETLPWYAHRPAESYQYLDVFNENLVQGFYLDEDGNMERLMRRFYIGDEDLSIEVRDGLMNFESDVKFGYPVYRSVQKYLTHSGKVYHYIFSYSGGRNFVKFTANITEEGAAHADELGYLFDMSLFTEEPTKEDQLVIDRMTTLWTNFVKYGDPTPEISNLLPIKWTAGSRNILNYLDIDSELTLKRRPFTDRMAFWDLFYKKYTNAVKGNAMTNDVLGLTKHTNKSILFLFVFLNLFMQIVR